MTKPLPHAPQLPAEVRARLEAGAALAVSVSGGKDSQALLSAVLRAREERGWNGPVFAFRADLALADLFNEVTP